MHTHKNPIWLLVVLLLGLTGGMLATDASAPDATGPVMVDDAPVRTSTVWYQVTDSDMQLPELPTGCEATALATDLRMMGVPVDKTEVAEAIPRTDDPSEAAFAFVGDPSTKEGWTCLAPCLVETANKLVPSQRVAVDLTGTDLMDLPCPCVVYVTVDMSTATGSGELCGDHELLRNTHCVVLTAIDGETACYVDPLRGSARCPLPEFNRAYVANGSQAVYVCERGYMPR